MSPHFGSFLTSASTTQESNNEASRFLPLWSRIITLVLCIVICIVSAGSMDFAFELSSKPFLPFALHIFTSRFDIFADSHLPFALTWGCYNIEFHFGPPSSLSPKLSPILDYGSLSAGSQIMEEWMSMTYTCPSCKGFSIWGSIFSKCSGPDHPPALALTDGMGPGQCWAFCGGSRQLGLWLAQAIQVSSLTVGHGNGSSMISAPKNIILWGLEPLGSDFCTTLGDVGAPKPDFGSGYCSIRILSSIYEPSLSATYQNFTSSAYTDTCYFDSMIVQVLGNWGHPSFTCIYHVQIYGNALSL